MSNLQGIQGIQAFTTRFSGGLDLSLPEESISTECLSRADNVEYSTNGVLQKCDGIRAVFDSGTVDIAFPFNNKTVFNSGNKLYYVDLTVASPTATLIGTLTGAGLNKQSFAYRDTDLLLASGGHLQKLSTAWALTTDSSSPYCDRVFIDNGRIMASLTADAGGTDSDYLYWASASNDTTWDLTPQPENDWTGVDPASYYTTALFLEIGYRDGLDIIDIQQLANDYIITKSNGIYSRQYRFSGTFPDWKVTQLSPSIPVVEAVGTINDIIFVGSRGVYSFANVMQYGDVQKDETGRKVNATLSQDVTTAAQIWHIPIRKQIYVKPSNTSVLWIYHYNQRNVVTGEVGAWTKRFLPYPTTHIWQDGNNVYMAMGSKICKIDPEIGSYALPNLVSDVAYDDDDIAFDDMDIAAGVVVYIKPGTVDGNEIPARLSGKKLTSSFLFNSVHYVIHTNVSVDGTANVSFTGYAEAFSFTGGDDIAYDDADIAFDDEDVAAGNTEYTRDVWFESKLTSSMATDISINSGVAAIRTLTIEYSEV